MVYRLLVVWTVSVVEWLNQRLLTRAKGGSHNTTRRAALSGFSPRTSPSLQLPYWCIFLDSCDYLLWLVMPPCLRVGVGCGGVSTEWLNTRTHEPHTHEQNKTRQERHDQQYSTGVVRRQLKTYWQNKMKVPFILVLLIMRLSSTYTQPMCYLSVENGKVYIYISDPVDIANIVSFTNIPYGCEAAAALLSTHIR